MRNSGNTGRSTVMSVPSSSSTLHSRCPFFPTDAESTWSVAVRRIPRFVRRKLKNRIKRDIVYYTPSENVRLFPAVLTKILWFTNRKQTSLYTDTPQLQWPSNKLPAFINSVARSLQQAAAGACQARRSSFKLYAVQAVCALHGMAGGFRIRLLRRT